ncbi:phosphate signaling complex protein PhoU [Natronospora cellulosivora (SeqCode)]
MRQSFHESLQELKNDVLKMASLVEESIDKSIKALQNGDIDLAKQVKKDDEKIDQLELSVEEKCTKLIALQQPVAKDLRLILVISKFVTDLERMGDHASNIAEQVLEIGQEELIKPLIDIPRMGEIAIRRLHQSLDAFVNMDIELAKQIAREDEEIDILDCQILRELISFMLEDQKTIKQATALMFVSRFLERIGDHSTNICERVIYLVNGEYEHY